VPDIALRRIGGDVVTGACPSRGGQADSIDILLRCDVNQLPQGEIIKTKISDLYDFSICFLQPSLTRQEHGLRLVLRASPQQLNVMTMTLQQQAVVAASNRVESEIKKMFLPGPKGEGGHRQAQIQGCFKIIINHCLIIKVFLYENYKV
jgi:hypothetical protein